MKKVSSSRKGYPHIRWIGLGLTVLTMLMAASLAKEMVRSRQIDNEIKALKEEAEALKVRNFEISSISASLDDKNFLEKEARTKLGLRKEGERVVVLSSATNREITKKERSNNLFAGNNDEWSNPKKWLMYFADRNSYDTYAVQFGYR